MFEVVVKFGKCQKFDSLESANKFADECERQGLEIIAIIYPFYEV